MPDNSDTPPRRRRRSPALFIAGLAVLVVVAAVGVFVWKFVIGGTERTDRQSKTFTETITRLELTGDSGSVDVVETDGAETVVESTLRWRGDFKPRHSHKVEGETLRLKDSGCREDFDFAGGCSVSWYIQVPSDVELDLKVDSGRIATAGIKGDQTLHTDSGGIEVTDPGEQLTITGDSGNIEAIGLPGTDVDVQLDSGRIELEFTEPPGDVRAEGDSGEIVVRLPVAETGYDVHAETSTGGENVEVETDPDSDHKVVVEADSGRVSVEYA